MLSCRSNANYQHLFNNVMGEVNIQNKSGKRRQGGYNCPNLKVNGGSIQRNRDGRNKVHNNFQNSSDDAITEENSEDDDKDKFKTNVGNKVPFAFRHKDKLAAPTVSKASGKKLNRSGSNQIDTLKGFLSGHKIQAPPRKEDTEEELLKEKETNAKLR